MSLPQTALFGTPQYVAPELLRGDTPTPRSDIFALAVLVYEVLARRKPFGGETYTRKK